MSFHERYLKDLTERDRYILDARDNKNNTFVEIAKKLGLSATGVSNIYKRIKKDEEIYKNFDTCSDDLEQTIHFLELPNTINNVLKRNNIFTISDLKEAYKSEAIYNFRCMGSVSLDLIKQSLIDKFSYDEEFMSYLDRYKCTVNDCMESSNGLYYFKIRIEDFVLNMVYDCIVEVENRYIIRYFLQNGTKNRITRLLRGYINEAILNWIDGN